MHLMRVQKVLLGVTQAVHQPLGVTQAVHQPLSLTPVVLQPGSLLVMLQGKTAGKIQEISLLHAFDGQMC